MFLALAVAAAAAHVIAPTCTLQAVSPFEAIATCARWDVGTGLRCAPHLVLRARGKTVALVAVEAHGDEGIWAVELLAPAGPGPWAFQDLLHSHGVVLDALPTADRWRLLGR
jgi:hypothetical protein